MTLDHAGDGRVEGTSVEHTAYEVAALAATPEGPDAPLWRQVLAEVRWSFIPPWYWLSGVAFNLVLSLLSLIVAPLRGGLHHDWAVLVGTYFAVWILADVTTTNVLGADALRVRLGLLRGVALARILIVKNLALLVIVGLPTLLATAVITLTDEPEYRLELTLPGVLYPMLTWLGVGNLVSVLLPVATLPIRQRWAMRRQLRPTVRWLVCLGVPYVLLLAVDPLGDLPRWLVRHLRFLPHELAVRGGVWCALGLGFYALATAVALRLARVRPIRIR